MPSPHSTSSHSSAHNNSDSINPDESYTLGEYTFTIQNVVVDDERIIQAHITGPEGSAAKGISLATSTELLSWSVECTETEASVYATVKETEYGPSSYVYLPQISGNTYGDVRAGGMYFGTAAAGGRNQFYSASITSGLVKAFRVHNNNGAPWLLYCSELEQQSVIYTPLGSKDNVRAPGSGLSRRYGNLYYADESDVASSRVIDGTWAVGLREYATIVEAFEDGKETERERLVARFAIDMREADPGSWDEPGDDGDPDLTLNLTVVGALSGRHNDPLQGMEPYSPADQTNVKGYGFGGDGGHGGGGGAGASTVIIREFATSRAGSKDVKAYARRHGYGSGGGKGGKGGDGCILVFY